MQIDRLFQMLYLLLEKESVTAKELAARFEVSTRTVYRDLETLSGAGVPVYAVKGRGGGIRILPGFVLDKSVLSRQEQSGILAALQGLKATGDRDAEKVLGKVSSLFQRSEAAWIAVDFKGWSGANDVFERLKQAVQSKQIVQFGYFGSEGKESQRTAEPLQLYFKGSRWYLKAYCRQAQAMRLFRLSRIRHLQVLKQSFSRQLEPYEQSTGDELAEWRVDTRISLQIDRSCAFRIYDEFEPDLIKEQADGSFEVQTYFPIDNWAVGYVLSFGDAAVVLAPEELRNAVAQSALAIAKRYGVI